MPPRARAGRATRRPPLSRERVLRAALLRVDRHGLGGLSMRALAGDLGVEAMSLYWHVPSKAALLDGVVEVMMGELDLVGAERLGWRDGLRDFAVRFRDLARAHPAAFSLVATRPLTAYLAGREAAEAGLARLTAAGFSPETAIRVQRTVIRYVLGFALAEIAIGDAWQRAPEGEGDVRPDGPPGMPEVLAAGAREDPDVLFAFGLDALLDGLATRGARTAS